ncbi:protein of unknown function [Burkholderia multivorans]
MILPGSALAPIVGGLLVAHALTIVSSARTIARQAAFLSSLDGFYYLAGIAICGGLFAAWQKEID